MPALGNGGGGGAPPPQPADEEYINRSLLDSLDAQADAEPLSSSDSEAPPINSNSVTAPISVSGSVPSIISNNSNSILPSFLKPSSHSSDSFSPHHIQQNNLTSHPVYNSMNSLASDFSLPPLGDHDPHNQQHKVNGFPSSTSYRSSIFSHQPLLNTRTSRSQHLPSAPSFRDTSSNAYSSQQPPIGFTQQPSQSDIYASNNSVSHIPSPPQQPATSAMHGYESIHRPLDGYGITGPQAGPGIITNGQPPKPGPYGGLDPYRLGMDVSLSSQSHLAPGNKQATLPGPPGLSALQQSGVGSQQNSFQNQGQPHLLAGIHGHHASQMSFGPSHLSAGVDTSGPLRSGASSQNVNGPNGMNQSAQNTTTNNQQMPQEEISTIFVVGFPEDMQEREFQNMFTFSAGFEAATLKIPNKELTAYGASSTGMGARSGAGSGGVNAGGTAGLPFNFSSQADPYNVVSLNQAGGNDGATPASWSGLHPGDNEHFVPNMQQPPRKQIIGFAKFRTRQEALEARDVLQGRRVDMEKGSVLKAEMAKKNLHTKRGPGVGGGGSGGGGSGGPGGVNPSGPTTATGMGGLINSVSGTAGSEALAGLGAGAAGLAGLGPSTNNASSGPELFSQRDRELGAMGIVGLAQRRDRLAEGRDDEDRRRNTVADVGGSVVNSLTNPHATFVPRGARERAEEDERERDRKRKEKEAQRMRQNSYAFEAFHSVPQQMVREGANSLLSAENGTMDGNDVMFGQQPPSTLAPNPPPNNPSQRNITIAPPPPSSSAQDVGFVGTSPWGSSLRDLGSSAALRKVSSAASGTTLSVSMSDATQSNVVSPSVPAAAFGHHSPPSREPALSPPAVTASNSTSSVAGTTSPLSPPSTDSRLRSISPIASDVAASQDHGTFSTTLAVAPTSEYASAVKPTSISSASSQSGQEEELSRAVSALNVNVTSANQQNGGSGESSTGTGGTTSPQLPSPSSTGPSGPRNPGDMNPPINTLYVGNLPTSMSPGGTSPVFLEEKLRELFSKRPGFRKLCFRQKNGPMCFVEFEDVSYATQTMKELHGHTLDGLIKNGGIRLSYSKNPLGVRTPTNTNGSSLAQQQSQHQLFFGDAFHPRQGEIIDPIRPRRDTSGMTSPPISATTSLVSGNNNPPSSSYHYTMSPPPPRFFTTSPPYGNSLAVPPPGNPNAFPRSASGATQPFGAAFSTSPPLGPQQPQHMHMGHMNHLGPMNHHHQMGLAMGGPAAPSPLPSSTTAMFSPFGLPPMSQMVPNGTLNGHGGNIPDLSNDDHLSQ